MPVVLHNGLKRCLCKYWSHCTYCFSCSACVATRLLDAVGDCGAPLADAKSGTENSLTAMGESPNKLTMLLSSTSLRARSVNADMVVIVVVSENLVLTSCVCVVQCSAMFVLVAIVCAAVRESSDLHAVSMLK